MQRAAERDVHLLQPPADPEQRHAAFHTSLRHRQRDVVARNVVRFVAGMRLGIEAGRMHIGARAGQHNAVDDIQQRADIGDPGRRREHQRQRICNLRHRAKIAFPDHLHREPVFDAMRVSDHAHHRFFHRLGLPVSRSDYV